MREISLFGRTALAVVLATATVVAVWAASKPSIKTPGSEKTIDQAIRVVNGTWRLEKRVNSDGTEHAKVDGITTIDLAKVNTKLLGDRALGTIQAREHGARLDSRFGSCVPVQARDKPFLTESVGTWDMTITSEDADTAMISVRQNHVIVKADFEPYMDGASSDVVATYRLFKAKPGKPAHMELAAPLSIKNPTTLKNEELAAKGQTVAADTTTTTDDESCCSVSTLQVNGNTMKINWANGGVDFWTRTSPTVSRDVYNLGELDKALALERRK